MHLCCAGLSVLDRAREMEQRGADGLRDGGRGKASSFPA